MTDDFEKEIHEIMGQIQCPKGFACYKNGFKKLCKARDIGIENYLECLEADPDKCTFSMTFGILQICKCPLRYYLIQHAKKDK